MRSMVEGAHLRATRNDPSNQIPQNVARRDAHHNKPLSLK
jgi:hypothetical protein